MQEQKATFEQNIHRLEEIVAALEKGDAPLADSLALFEEGTALIAACSVEPVSYTHLRAHETA